jgi:hypothetical protein
VLRALEVPKDPRVTTISETSNPDLETTKNTYTDLRAVFNWLYDNGVRKIVRVTVIDYGDLSHNDSAIEEALTRFEVEFWNWKKVDLCSQVIKRCSLSVREISLYWTGNHAVMMGWASQEGFYNHENFPKVPHVPVQSSGRVEIFAIADKEHQAPYDTTLHQRGVS